MGVISFVLIISLGPMVLPDNKGGLFREVREHGDNLVTALDITQAGVEPEYTRVPHPGGVRNRRTVEFPSHHEFRIPRISRHKLLSSVAGLSMDRTSARRVADGSGLAHQLPFENPTANATWLNFGMMSETLRASVRLFCEQLAP